MSDYFFYDMNKKMADLAKRQQLAEEAQAAPATPAPMTMQRLSRFTQCSGRWRGHVALCSVSAITKKMVFHLAC